MGQSIPQGPQAWTNPPQLCPSSQARPKGSGCYCGGGGLGGAGPSPPARVHSGRNLPGGLLEPGTQLRPPSRPPDPRWAAARGPEAAAHPPGPRTLTRSLPARAASLPPAPGRPAPAAAAPFVSRTGLSRSHGPPAPSPPLRKDLPRPLPSNPHRPPTPASPPPLPPRAPTPLFPPLAPHPRLTRPLPSALRRPALLGPPSSDPGLSRPRASVRSPNPIPHAPVWSSIGPSPGLPSPFPPGRPLPSTATEP